MESNPKLQADKHNRYILKIKRGNNTDFFPKFRLFAITSMHSFGESMHVCTHVLGLSLLHRQHKLHNRSPMAVLR
jgi:hypothetical protein